MGEPASMADKIALVTGGGSGLGHAAALAFARRGAHVVVADISNERAQAVAAEITKDDGAATPIQCDVRDASAIKAMFALIMEKYGRLDFAFNNAGIGGPVVPLLEYPENEWHNLLSTNLTSIFLCMQQELEIMLKQGEGSIVNCASVSGMVGMPGLSAYCATKHAILGLTKAAALDYATSNVRINAVCPGTIHTPAVDNFVEANPDTAPAFIKQMEDAQPIGRLGRPAEIGEAVAWLCSPAASFMLGQGLVVDGGYLAR